jgi:hypothetical protein
MKLPAYATDLRSAPVCKKKQSYKYMHTRMSPVKHAANCHFLHADLQPGFDCSPCPDGFAGTGQLGCDPTDYCDPNQCDPLTECTSGGGTFECSACPEGYTGSGVISDATCVNTVEGVGTCTTATDAAVADAGTCPDADCTFAAQKTGCDDINEWCVNFEQVPSTDFIFSHTVFHAVS